MGLPLPLDMSLLQDEQSTAHIFECRYLFLISNVTLLITLDVYLILMTSQLSVAFNPCLEGLFTFFKCVSF